MKDKLSAFWSGFKDKWSSLAKNLRIFIITAVSVVIVAAIVLAIVLNQKGYTAIYTGLDSEESSQVVSAINELGITDVKMGTDGSISVPSDQADNVRMQLSIQGYPKSTFNFDVWNSGIGIWSTDTEKKVLQIQQLQTHLMKAINTISAVKNSYVIITMPENSNYVISTDSEEPRVSVKLDLKNGAQLTSDQVEGIYALVLNSLPGLERENISILDSDGKLLSGENTTVEEDVLYQSRLNFQEQMQSLLKSQLNDTLKKLYKDYTINVNVKLNYDNSKSEYTIYTPSVAEDGTSGGMIESSTKNEGWGGIGSLSGVVGTTSNSDISPNYPTIKGDDDNQYYYQNSITVKRLVNTEIRQLEKKFDNLVTADTTEVGGIDYVAEVMNNVDRATEKYIFDELTLRDPKLADDIRSKMFVFEDIVTLDNMAIQAFIPEVDSKDLAVAIKGSTPEVAECIYANMSTRMRESVQTDVEYLHNVRMRDVEEAQQRIVSIIRRLEDEGTLVISKGGKEDEIIA